MFDLQRYRKDKKLDQKHISILTGLDQAIISKYENGKHVTQHVTETLLKAIPELESYMIQEKTIVKELIEEYIRSDNTSLLIKSIQDVIKNNEKLINNNTLLVETNAMLSNYLIKLKERREMEHH